jgi:hypothetical protein
VQEANVRGAQRQKKEQLESLVGEIRVLKTEIDQKHQEALNLQQGIETFTSRYEQYVRILDTQRSELEDEVQHYRDRIEHFHNPLPTVTEPSSTDKEDVSRKDIPEVSEEEPFISESLPLHSEKAVEEEKQQIRRHFARFWHPDRHPENGSVLMSALSVAFTESHDAVDMLIAVPWHEAWIQREEKETWYALFGRLTWWKPYLEEAIDRLDQQLVQMKQDWQYSEYQKWQEASESPDYFAALASQERREITRLEQTLETLKEELTSLEDADSRGQA